jgi:tRNA pseudouridine55 synthase
MARRKKGRRIHGWVVLDKPAGMTSTQAVEAVRCAFDAQKAGHAGTLDPIATGILPIALGEATKTVPFVVDREKVYRFSVRWGAETTTDDSEGRICRTSTARPCREAIEALLPSFVGEILQVPPTYSAVKIEGERAYDRARDGELVVLEPRPVVIEKLQLIAMPDVETAAFETACGKGTYVRAIARDLGRALGCYSHVVALRRLCVGPFDESRAVAIDALRAGGGANEQPLGLLAVEAALVDVMALTVSDTDAARLAQGQPVLIRGRDAPILTGMAYAISKGRLVALGELVKGELRPTRVFNLN